MSTHSAASGRPARDEAAPYYFKYIDRIENPDVVPVLDAQLPAMLDYLRSFSEEASLQRYEPGKWSVRQVLGHISDCERLFVARAFWFARGFSSALPSFDQEVCASAAEADAVAWADHLDEFRNVRLATLSFFRNLPPAAWSGGGVASDRPFTVRALAYIAAGHADHHVAVLRERYRGQ
jgi:DinB superfamily